MPFLTTIGSVLTGGATAGTTATTGIAGTGISGSTVLSAGSAVLGGLAEFQASRYQAAVAKANAKVAEFNARRAIEESQLRQQDQDAITAAFIGDLVSRQGASGFALESGSFTRSRATARKLGRLDAERIRDVGLTEAIDFQNQAASFKAESRAAKSAGAAGLLGGFVRAGGTLLGRARPTRRSALRSFAV